MNLRHKKRSLYLLSGLFVFLTGYLTGTLLAGNSGAAGEKARRVTGIGGIFFKSKDPVALRKWYGDHLGFGIDEYGTNFEWREALSPETPAFTQWSPFHEKTKYFLPSEKDFMVNYRVEDLAYVLGELHKEGITPLDTVAVYDYGKFVHLLDPEGNKIELWEPVDSVYNKYVNGRTR